MQNNMHMLCLGKSEELKGTQNINLTNLQISILMSS